MIRNVNEGLDELRDTIGKMHTLCETAEQMSPVLKQLAQMVAEVRQQAASGKAGGRQVSLSEAPYGERRTRKRRAKRSTYRRASAGRR
ncbi:hypothetical protein SAMN02799630_05387 [Paenibacillus sp. UNCCL117]|nr:hypothetical protein SAMN04488602_12756 [Paenibacillus sp. cl123]SFW65470.1 hypothetical protein SAMN02799630_05387 [Paenibacillus sp. UNCCL117]